MPSIVLFSTYCFKRYPFYLSMARVELLHVMGNDLMVVNAARVSFAKESTEFKQQDGKLINYLAKHNHISPFFHPQIQFRIRMPIFVAREWYRHQIGFARNEVSRRYVSDMPECWVPTFREKDSNLKQGSKETTIELDDVAKNVYDTSTRISLEAYDELLKLGVAPEVARTVLPQSMYTEFIETGSLAAYSRLYKLRTSPDAQREIQFYANEIGKCIEEKFPVSWKALVE
jgi:thymidylate synthase (FAD)